MPVHPYGFGGNSSGKSIESFVSDLPSREVFVKDTDGSMIGTGMRLLPDGKLLAPDGFSVESGSIDFGDVITMSESSGFVGIRNNLYNQMYQAVDYNVPRNDASKNPSIFQLNESEWMFTAQSDDSNTLTSNPLFFNYTTTLDARTNSITFRSSVAMTNVRIKITKSDVNVALKYLPSKSSWSLGTGGYNFVAGDNIIDFKDSPVPLSSGVMLTFEIRATNISLKGNNSGVPYFGVMTQRGQFQNLPLSNEVTAAAIRDKLTSLSSPNKLPKNSIQDSVLSVNGQFGDVVLDYEDVGAQQQDSTLQQISELNISSNSLFHVDSVGNINQIPITNAGVDWLTYTSADSQKSQLGLSVVASSGSYNDLTNKPTIPNNNNQLTNGSGYITSNQAPVQSVNGQVGAVLLTIPAAQIQSDWNQSNTGSLDYIKNKPNIPVVNYPVTSVNGKTGTVVLTNTDVGAAATSHTHIISDVVGLQSALNAKFSTPTGNTTQYVRGDGTLATFPSIPTVPSVVSAFTNDSGYITSLSLIGYKKTETFLGTTDASGNYTITFANTYSTAPDVQPQIIGGTFNQMVRVVSVSTTGCVVQAAQRNLVTLLSIEVLLGATVPLSGASVTVQVTSRT